MSHKSLWFAIYFVLGPVTYRVVQVATQDGTESQPQVVTTTGLPAGAQVVVFRLNCHKVLFMIIVSGFILVVQK